MSEALIEEAFDERLLLFSWTDPHTTELIDASVAANIDWSGQGVKFKPNVDVSYLRATLHRPITKTQFQGHPILSTKTGFYEVQCRRPKAYGNKSALMLAGAVARHFFPATGANLYLPTSGNEMIVQIEEDPEVEILASSPEGGFVAAAALIKYKTQVPRSN